MKEEIKAQQVTQQMTDSIAVTYLALGDSYTYGESVEREYTFPSLLVDSLAKSKIVLKPTVVAKTGWTTDELNRGIDETNLLPAYDIVSLLIGVNNQYRGRSVNDFKIEFIDLINRAIKFAKGDKSKVFIISIPDYGYTPFGKSNRDNISKGIDIYNELSKDVADSLGIKYFYITDISRRGLSEPELVASDGLHPSAEMYKLWVNLMKKDLEILIRK